MPKRLAQKPDRNYSVGHSISQSKEPLPPYELDPMFDSAVIRNRVGGVIAKAVEKRIRNRGPDHIVSDLTIGHWALLNKANSAIIASKNRGEQFYTDAVACQPYYRKLHLSMAASWLSLARREEAIDNLFASWDTAKPIKNDAPSGVGEIGLPVRLSCSCSTL